MTPKEFSDALRNDPEAAINAVGEGRFDPNSSHDGLPALMEAVASRESGIVALLIKQGARVDEYAREPSSMRGLAAIHVAGTPNLVGMLARAGAFVDAPIRDIDRSWAMRGETALHIAALDMSADVAGALLSHGANPHLPFNTSGPSTPMDVRSGQTLFGRLAQFKQVDVARREHNQAALENQVQAKIVRIPIPMTTDGLAHMHGMIESHKQANTAANSEAIGSVALSNLAVPALRTEPSTIEKSARAVGRFVASLIEDAKFMANAIKTRVQYDALSPQTGQQKVASVIGAINDGTALFMADAKRSMQAYREQAAEVQKSHKSDSAQSPHG